MIALYLLCIIAGIGAFALLQIESISLRIGIAIAVMLAPSIVLTFLTMRIGDAPLPGSKPVDPKDVDPDNDQTRRSN